MKKMADFRELSKEELINKLTEVKKSIFNLKFQKSIGQLENVMQIKNLKRDVARLETLLKEKESDTQEKESVKK
jgi:large subunit ribosomal protein L29